MGNEQHQAALRQSSGRRHITVVGGSLNGPTVALGAALIRWRHRHLPATAPASLR